MQSQPRQFAWPAGYLGRSVIFLPEADPWTPYGFLQIAHAAAEADYVSRVVTAGSVFPAFFVLWSGYEPRLEWNEELQRYMVDDESEDFYLLGRERVAALQDFVAQVLS